MKTYDITLSDGRKIEGVFLSGTTYVYKGSLDPSIFNHNLKNVKITEIDNSNIINEETKSNLYLSSFFKEEDSVYFSFYEKTQFQIFQESIESKIDYIIMMTDLDI